MELCLNLRYARRQCYACIRFHVPTKSSITSFEYFCNLAQKCLYKSVRHISRLYIKQKSSCWPFWFDSWFYSEWLKQHLYKLFDSVSTCFRGRTWIIFQIYVISYLRITALVREISVQCISRLFDTLLRGLRRSWNYMREKAGKSFIVYVVQCGCRDRCKFVSRKQVLYNKRLICCEELILERIQCAQINSKRASRASYLVSIQVANWMGNTACRSGRSDDRCCLIQSNLYSGQDKPKRAIILKIQRYDSCRGYCSDICWCSLILRRCVA